MGADYGGLAYFCAQRRPATPQTWASLAMSALMAGAVVARQDVCPMRYTAM